MSRTSLALRTTKPVRGMTPDWGSKIKIMQKRRQVERAAETIFKGWDDNLPMRRSLAQLWYQVTYLRKEDLKINLAT